MNNLKLFVNDEIVINIPKEKCIPIELLINKSEYNKEWLLLGDKLYYFSNPRNSTDEITTFQITKSQYNFIKNCLNTLQ